MLRQFPWERATARFGKGGETKIMSFRIAALTAALAAALLLVGGAGAGGQPPKKVDLTNPAAVSAYLTSIGIDPATVVKQVGLNNYAGPNCPGVGWNCTTSLKVVQVSSAGGQNKFDCEGQEPPNVLTNPATNTCVVMQGGPNNAAQCKEKNTGDDEAQHCTINQSGDRNLAIVDQLIEQRQGPQQSATQTVDVEQTATDKNESQIHQEVHQQTSVDIAAPGSQDQNVHQVAIVNQGASGSLNFSHVHQNQDLSESGQAGIQNQNVGGLPAGITDCDLEHKLNSEPNACANVTQTITDPSGGTNESHLHQNISENAKTTAAAATQTQEQPLSGIEGHVDQENPPGLGTDTKITHQDARQRAEGGTTQTQIIDPNCCGVGTTIGGAKNMDQFHQTAIQSATSGAAAFQELGITGDTNHVASEEAPSFASAATSGGGVSNVCIIHHDARNNTDSTAFTFKIDPCDIPITIETRCLSASAADEETGPGCTHTSPPSECPCIDTPLQSSPTFGNPIAPPDFGEPSDFPGPTFPGI